MNSLTNLGAKAGPFFIAFSLLFFSVQHFAYADPIFVGGFGPEWIPGRAFWAYFFGVAFILGAIAILFNKKVQLTATILALLIFVFTLFFFLPVLVSNIYAGGAWTNTFKGFTLCGCMLLVAGSQHEQNRFVDKNVYRNIGGFLMAITMVIFGIEHFIYIEFVTMLVPEWMPARTFWSYFCGVALIAAGVGIIIRKKARLAASLLGLMIFLWVIMLHIPRAIATNTASEWTNTFIALTFSGGAFILASMLPEDSDR